jgi:hypothetical protein
MSGTARSKAAVPPTRANDEYAPLLDAFRKLMPHSEDGFEGIIHDL